MLGDPREPENSIPRTSSVSVNCSLCAVFPGMFVPTTARVRRQSRPDWIGAVGAKTPISSLAVLGKRLLRKLQLEARDELLDGEIFYTLEEARVIIENWRRCYNEIRPHSSPVTGRQPRVLMPARPAAQPEPASPHHWPTTNPELIFKLDHSVGQPAAASGSRDS